MNREELAQRYQHAQNALGGTLERLGTQSLCHVIEDEMDLESHDLAHLLLSTIVVHGQANQYTSPAAFVSLAFNLGRKFGMMEAADSMTINSSNGS